jgi:hypothetical protein
MKNKALAFASLAIVLCTAGTAAQAADNLRMRDGVSFVHDLDKTFPIVGDKLDDVEIAAGKPTFVFFGAAGDLNTNRQAKRIVELYKKYKTNNVKFIVIDVDHPVNPSAKALIKTHYQGYIPGQVVFDKAGKKQWNHTGEVDTTTMASQIDKLLN